MNDRLNALLAELVAMDPSLRGRERDLEPLLSELVASRPDASLDPAFVQRLRVRLLNLPKPVAPMPAPAFSFRPFAFAGAGALVAVLVAVPLTYRSATGGFRPVAPQAAGIATLADGAFGSLAGSPADGMAASGAAERSAAPQAAPMPVGAGGGNAAFSADAKMAIYPPEWQPVTHRYAYDGAIPAEEAEAAVYRRSPLARSVPASGALLASLPQGAVDLSAFSDLVIGSLELKETRDRGYVVYMSAYDGSLSIAQNWEKWPQPDWSVPFAREDMLSDAEAIRIADAFVGQYGLDRGRFGAGTVMPQPLIIPFVREDGTSEPAYVPDTANVTYPLLVDGIPVHNEDGSAYGMTVSVSARTRAVSNAYVPPSDGLESSAYALETDEAALRKVLDRGGLSWWEPEGGKLVDVALGKPTRVLMPWWRSTATGGEQLFVPALRFPVTTPPADEPYFRQAVMVPIVKEVLESAQAQPPVTIMEKPMPADAGPAAEPMILR